MKDSKSLLNQKGLHKSYSLKSLLRHANMKDYCLFTIGLFATVFYSALPGIFCIQSGTIYNKIDTFTSIEDFYSTTAQISVKFLLLISASVFLGSFSTICFIKLGLSQSLKLQALYFDSLINTTNQCGISRLPKVQKTLKKVSKATRLALGEKTMVFFNGIFMFFNSTLIIFYIHPLLCLLFLLYFFLQVISMNIIHTKKEYHRALKRQSKSINSFEEDSIKKRSEILSNNNSSLFVQRYSEMVKFYCHLEVCEGITLGFGVGLTLANLSLFQGMLFYVSSLINTQGWGEGVAPGFVVTVFFVANITINQFSNAMSAYRDIEICQKYVGRVYEQISNVSTDIGYSEIVNVKGRITIEKIDFEYNSPYGASVLSGLSLDIPAQKVTVINGEKGSGKTTILQLILRLSTPRYGKILIDGVDHTFYSTKSLRTHLSVKFQEIFLLHTTIKENILLGTSLANEDSLQSTCKCIGLDAFINGLVEGYDTMVTDDLKLPNEIKHKICLARALMKKTKILLIDDPTESFFPDEDGVSAINTAAAGKTCVVFDRGLSFVPVAEYAWVISQGKAVQLCNNHTETQALNANTDTKYGEDQEVSDNKNIINELKLSFIAFMIRHWHWVLLVAIFAVTANLAFVGFGYLFALNITGVILLDSNDSLELSLSSLYCLTFTSILLLILFPLLIGSLFKIRSLSKAQISCTLFSQVLELVFYSAGPPGIFKSAKNPGFVVLLKVFVMINAILAIFLSSYYSTHLSLAILVLFCCFILIIIKRNQYKTYGFIEYNNSKSIQFALHSVKNQHLLKVYNQEASCSKQYTRLVTQENYSAVKQGIISGIVYSISVLFPCILNRVSISYGFYLVMTGVITFEEMVFAGFIMIFISNSIYVYEQVASFKSQNTLPKLAVVKAANSYKKSAEHNLKFLIKGELEFRNVSCTSGDGEILLNSISLNVRSDALTGIFTKDRKPCIALAYLLLRFVDPDEGAVLIDGIDSKYCDPLSLRRQISYIPSEPILFKGSIRYNFDLANPEATDNEILEACSVTECFDCIDRTDAILDRTIGVKKEELTKEELQKLCIARALTKKSKVLIFDNAFGCLKESTEKSVLSYMGSRHLSVILISDAARSLRTCSNIFTFTKGRCSHIGNYSSLLKCCHSI